MHRSDPKRAFLVQQQISELGPEDAHRVFQQRLKYRLQFTGRRSDDFENLSAREQLLQGLVPLPDESRDLFFRACRDRTATTHGLRCMAAPFDRCTAYFGAPFHTHLGCGQTIVVRLAGTLEAGPGIPRSEYMRRRLMCESGHQRPMRSKPHGPSVRLARKRPSAVKYDPPLRANRVLTRRSKKHRYSITSSARASSVGGTSRPSTLAVVRLITSSNLVGNSIGRSPALAPFRILSTKAAVRRQLSYSSTP